MVKVLFFASLREQAGVDSLLLSVPEPASIRALVQLVGEQLSSALADRLLEENTVIAVNYETAKPDHMIRDNDEIAFYPPVTGG